jgi:hypothetical protein
MSGLCPDAAAAFAFRYPDWAAAKTTQAMTISAAISHTSRVI